MRETGSKHISPSMHSEETAEADKILSQLDNKKPIRNSEDVIKYKKKVNKSNAFTSEFPCLTNLTLH